MSMLQRRWVSYIFRYRNYERCEIAGFIKVQRINTKNTDVTRIRIGLKMYKEYPCVCTAYLLIQGKAKPFTSISFMSCERDAIMSSVELPWNDPLGDGIAFPEYEGIFFLCDDGEMLAGMWDAECQDIKHVMLPEKLPIVAIEQEDEQQELQLPETQTQPYNEEVSEIPIIEDIIEDIGSEEHEPEIFEPEEHELEEHEPETDGTYINEQEINEEEINEVQLSEVETASCSEILSTYPKLPLFAGSSILDGVKIVPQDIGKLDMANWKLGVNSFLAHGYYKYQYLMLGRVKLDKTEAYVIGVPGVFTNKERYLANMFGFRVFIPVKKTKILTGNFGYWVSEIVEKS